MANNSEAVIAANRFGLGARPGELTRINSDAHGWLKAQLVADVPEVIADLPPSSQIFVEQVEALKAQRELRKQLAEQQGAANDDAPKPDMNPKRRVIVAHYLQQVAARYQVATHSEASFRERLVHFWSNHFAVSSDKLAVGALAGTLENEAIRPNLHRHFHDLLLAAESHPAMILYLDNQASIGPNSQLAQLAERRGKQRKLDINENLPREILELHTLGVNGGYSQRDVTTFANILTGWSVGGGQGRLAVG